MDESWRLLPKVELHCHLDGILDPVILRDILRDDPTFPIDPTEFERAYPVDGYERFFAWWNYIRPLEGLEHFYPIVSSHIARLKAQKVRYAEIMIASGELPQDGAGAVEAVSAFREWVDRLEGDDLQVEFLIAFGRQKPVEQVERIAERIMALYRAGLIVGVALAGPERGNPVAPFQLPWLARSGTIPLRHFSASLPDFTRPDWGSRSTPESGAGQSRSGMR
jgi:adenosine deaminase